jgi:hypothetical protein
MMNFLTYITGFFMNFELLPILTDYEIKKKGGWNLKKFFSSETTEPISTKPCWNDPWVVPFQKYVRRFGPSPKFGCNWPSGFWGEDFYVNFP